MPRMRTVAIFSLILAMQWLAQPSHAQLLAPVTSDSVPPSKKLLGWAVSAPCKAGILAAIIPGAGQVYNHQYWKLPLVYGALGGATYVEVQYWRLYREYKAGQQARRRFENGELNAADMGPNSSKEPTNHAQEARFNSYRIARDKWLGITAGIYGLQILDAITAAHLGGFDISENLALHMAPTLLIAASTTAVPSMQLSIRTRGSSHTNPKLLP